MGLLEAKLEEKLAHVAATVALEGDRTRIAMAAGMAETIRGLRVDGSLPKPLPPAGGIVYGAGCRLVGWSARESGGTDPVSVDLYTARGAGDVEPGNLVATFTVPAGGSVAHTVMPAGVSVVDGLWAVVSGTGVLAGVAWIGAVD